MALFLALYGSAEVGSAAVEQTEGADTLSAQFDSPADTLGRSAPVP